jgi:cyclic pyranopterin phosphate synthase
VKLPVLVDSLARRVSYVRISLTDRCNYRCHYCMPEDEYVWLPRHSILTFEEIDRVAGVFARLGVSKIRLTGGEPLLRHDLPTLVALLARHPELTDLALTTNGILLERYAADRAGSRECDLRGYRQARAETSDREEPVLEVPGRGLRD